MKNLLLVLGMSLVCGCFYAYLEDQRIAQETTEEVNNAIESQNRLFSMDSASRANNNKVTIAKLRYELSKK